MDEERASPESHAPFSLVAISALLWTQGVIWALLGTAAALALPARGFGGGLIAAVLFGFTAWSWILGTVLPRRGSDRARRAAAGHEIFMTWLGLAVLGTCLFTLAGLFFIAPVGLFIVFGIFCSACAVAGLQTAPAREYCQPRTTLSLPAITWASPRSRLSPSRSDQASARLPDRRRDISRARRPATCAPHQPREVVALSATGQVGMAAPWQIQVCPLAGYEEVSGYHRQ